MIVSIFTRRYQKVITEITIVSDKLTLTSLMTSENRYSGLECYEVPEAFQEPKADYGGPWVTPKRKHREHKPDVDALCAQAKRHDHLVRLLNDHIEYDEKEDHYYLKKKRGKNKKRKVTTGHYVQQKLNKGLVVDKTHSTKGTKVLPLPKIIDDSKGPMECHGMRQAITDVVLDVAQHSLDQVISTSIDSIENIVLLIVALATSGNAVNATSVIALYMKSNFKITFTKTMHDVCEKFLTESSMSVQGSVNFYALVSEAYQLASTDWKTFINSPIFKHLTQIICLGVSVGYFSSYKDKGHFTVKGMTFLASKMREIQKNSSSFYEAIGDSIIFFVTKGYQCFMSGNLEHFFYSDKEIHDSDILYTKLVAAEQLLTAGKLHLLGEQGIDDVTCEAEYNLKIVKLIQQYETLSKTQNDKHIKSIMIAKILKLRSLLFALRKAQTNVKFKKRPFSLMISGPSSIGKSTLNSILITTVLQANGMPTDDEFRCVINETDKYDTEIHAYTRSITLDDWANLRPEKCEESPTRRIIDIINNVAKTAVKADVDEKGTVLVQPDILTLTTNVADLNCRAWSVEPASIMRRFDFIITPTLKPTHRNALGGLDSVAVDADSNAWLFKIECVRIVPSKQTDQQKRTPDDFRFVTIKENIEIHELCDFMRIESIKHFQLQNSLVNKYHGEINKVCLACGYCQAICRCDLELTGLATCKDVRDNMTTHGLQSNRTFAFGEDSYACELKHLYKNILSFFISYLGWRYLLFYLFSSFGRNVYRSLESLFMAFLTADPTMRKLRFDTAFLRIDQCYVQHKMFVMESLAKTTLKFIYKRNETRILRATFGLVGVSLGAALSVLILRAMSAQKLVHIAQGGQDSNLRKSNNNIWLRPSYFDVPKADSSVGITPEQLRSNIAKALAIIKISKGKNMEGIICNILPLKGDLWLLPAHMLPEQTTVYWAEMSRTRDAGVIAPRFQFEMLPEDRRYVKNKDFCIVRIRCAGDQPDMQKFICVAKVVKPNYCYNMDFLEPESAQCTLVSGEIRTISAESTLNALSSPNPKPGDMTTVQVGHAYTSFCDTKPGMCMATVTTAINGAEIVGFHSAGHTGSKSGFISTIVRADLDDAFKHFETSGMTIHSSGSFDTNIYGICLDIEQRSHYKSAVNFMDDRDINGVIRLPSAEIYGTHSVGRASPFTNVVKTFISDDVDKIEGLENIFQAPSNKELKKHWHKDLTLRCKNSIQIPAGILKKAVADLRRHVKSKTRNADLSKVRVLESDAILSGLNGEYGIDGVNLNTSLGFPLNKPKKTLLKESDRKVEGISRVLDMPEFLIEDIARRELNYLQGERCYPIFRTTLKDEPVKINKDKRRLFEAAPFWYVYLMRKYTLSICAYIMENRLDFCTAVGANVHSNDWSDFVEYLSEFESGKYIAGDYKAFDKNMPAEVIIEAFSFIVDIARASNNYSDEDILVMNGIITDLAFPILEFDTLLMKVFTSHCSGNSLTVILNNFANLIYMRCAYYSMYDGNPPCDFDERVHILVYGDDNIAEISDDEKVFNHTTCSKALMEFGIEYTMADKTSESVPYSNLSELDFLKRKFRYDSMLHVYVAPLELTSIAKSLHFRIINKSCDMGPRHIMSDIIINVFTELYYHGQDVYDKISIELYNVVLKHDLQTLVGPYLSYADMYMKLYSRYYDDKEDDDGSIDMQNFEIQSGCVLYFEIKNNTMGFITQPNDRHVLDLTLQNQKLSPNNKERCMWRTQSIYHSELETRLLDGIVLLPMNSTDNMIIHSMDTADDFNRVEQTVQDTHIQEEVMIMDTAQPGTMVKVSKGMEDSMYTISHDSTDIGQFLQRPVRIARFTYAVNTVPFTNFFPWRSFIDDPSIKMKLANYAFLRGRLHVRFELTGSPFRSGKIMASYLPNIVTNTGPTTIARTFINDNSFHRITASQRMKVIMNVTNGQGGDMILPFMYCNDYLRLSDSFSITQMGAITIQGLSTIGSINSNDNTAVTLTIYAWMENVELVGPTSFVIQSGYESGPLSKPASVIAGIAHNLVDVPVIGPYMKATAMVSNTIAKVAAMFGFSRPNSIVTENRMIPHVAGNFCNLNAEDTVYKLTADIKQELTVDPRVADLGNKDELSIMNIVGIESYLFNFGFNATTLPGTLLTVINVTPTAFDIDTNTEPTNPIYMTAMCTVSQTFRNWRGGIKYRFVASSSALFRGKLKIVYEPAVVSVTPTTELSETSNYSYIMDLAQTDDFTVCVNWCSSRQYLRCNTMNIVTIPFDTPPTIPIYDDIYHNGRLFVYVLNELSSPGDVVANCPISVFCSMCDDAEFTVPSLSTVSGLVPYVAQSGEALQFNMMTDKTQGTSVVAEFGNKIVCDERNSVYYGERIVSARSLFKRYCHVMTEQLFNDSDTFRRRLYTFIKWRYLAYRGFDSAGVHLVEPGRGNFANWSYIHWYRLAFAGERGGTRVKILKNVGNYASNSQGYIIVTATQRRVGLDFPPLFAEASPSLTSSIYADTLSTTANGVAISAVSMKPALEVEIPDYSGLRYRTTSQLYATDDLSNLQNFNVTSEQNDAGSTLPESFSYYVASAEDYTLLYWCGMPPVTPLGLTPRVGNPYPLPL